MMRKIIVYLITLIFALNTTWTGHAVEHALSHRGTLRPLATARSPLAFLDRTMSEAAAAAISAETGISQAVILRLTEIKLLYIDEMGGISDEDTKLLKDVSEEWPDELIKLIRVRDYLGFSKTRLRRCKAALGIVYAGIEDRIALVKKDVAHDLLLRELLYRAHMYTRKEVADLFGYKQAVERLINNGQLPKFEDEINRGYFKRVVDRLVSERRDGVRQLIPSGWLLARDILARINSKFPDVTKVQMEGVLGETEASLKVGVKDPYIRKTRCGYHPSVAEHCMDVFEVRDIETSGPAGLARVKEDVYYKISWAAKALGINHITLLQRYHSGKLIGKGGGRAGATIRIKGSEIQRLRGINLEQARLLKAGELHTAYGLCNAYRINKDTEMAIYKMPIRRVRPGYALLRFGNRWIPIFEDYLDLIHIPESSVALLQGVERFILPTEIAEYTGHEYAEICRLAETRGILLREGRSEPEIRDYTLGALFMEDENGRDPASENFSQFCDSEKEAFLKRYPFMAEVLTKAVKPDLYRTIPLSLTGLDSNIERLRMLSIYEEAIRRGEVGMSHTISLYMSQLAMVRELIRFGYVTRADLRDIEHQLALDRIEEIFADIYELMKGDISRVKPRDLYTLCERYYFTPQRLDALVHKASRVDRVLEAQEAYAGFRVSNGNVVIIAEDGATTEIPLNGNGTAGNNASADRPASDASVTIKSGTAAPLKTASAGDVAEQIWGGKLEPVWAENIDISVFVKLLELCQCDVLDLQSGKFKGNQLYTQIEDRLAQIFVVSIVNAARRDERFAHLDLDLIERILCARGLWGTRPDEMADYLNGLAQSAAEADENASAALSEMSEFIRFALSIKYQAKIYTQRNRERYNHIGIPNILNSILCSTFYNLRLDTNGFPGAFDGIDSVVDDVKVADEIVESVSNLWKKVDRGGVVDNASKKFGYKRLLALWPYYFEIVEAQMRGLRGQRSIMAAKYLDSHFSYNPTLAEEPLHREGRLEHFNLEPLLQCDCLLAFGWGPVYAGAYEATPRKALAARDMPSTPLSCGSPTTHRAILSAA
ncbi:MAG: hypothetical protein HQ558_00360 [Candidatus Omnitrophica bacterium]|nr:hypothetical protein [Candidatus Omnitrophota bacterium]